MGDYEVTGIHKVFGHKKGESFSKKLDPAHERRLIASRAIKKKGKSNTRKKEKKG